METVSANRSHAGTQGVYFHASEETGTDMTFSVYVPDHEEGAKLPVLWYLSGLTCTHANVIVFGLGGIGLNVLQGARMVGADKIIGVDINDDREEWGRKFGMTHFVNPKKIEGDIVEHLVALTDGGADYTFDCTGNTDVMRQALEACHRGWGESIIIGVAEAGKEIATRPFQLVTGRVWKGTAFGGARGRTDVPKIVDWYVGGKIEIDPMITHTLTLDEINKGFDLMHAGESIRSVVVF